MMALTHPKWMISVQRPHLNLMLGPATASIATSNVPLVTEYAGSCDMVTCYVIIK